MPLSKKRKRIFSSVFPSSAIHGTPTPEATPETQFTAPGQPFGLVVSPLKGNTEGHPEIVAKEILSNRAWHTVTSYLSLSALRGAAAPELPHQHNLQQKEAPSDLTSSISFICNDAEGQGYGELIRWYLNEVEGDFHRRILPKFHKPAGDQDIGIYLNSFINVVRRAFSVYLEPMDEFILPIISDGLEIGTHSQQMRDVNRLRKYFWRDLRAMVAYSLPKDLLNSLTTEFLEKECHIILDGHPPSDDDAGNLTTSIDEIQKRAANDAMKDDPNIQAARNRVLKIVLGLHDIGIGSSYIQKLFAEVMNRQLSNHVENFYTGRWQSPSNAILYHLDKHKGIDGRKKPEDLPALYPDMKQWQDSACDRLGKLRVHELFDVVVEWDDSKGAIEDLKTYTNAPESRKYLTDNFRTMLQQRLLHSGASTIQILQVYISIIRAFAMLDPKGVLLDRVARPIRRYLRERDDSVKVIIAGLLADAVSSEEVDDPGKSDVLLELAIELKDTSSGNSRNDDDVDLDYRLSWVPDPVDAAPDYKKSKINDVIGSMLTLFDTQDVFVTEFQNVLGERLLRKEHRFESEIRVMEMLKVRIGESALQSCEVMLRDIKESKKLDKQISQQIHEIHHDDHQVNNEVGARHSPQVHSKILSRLFWPSLHNEEFRIPSNISAMQQKYELGFEDRKNNRKLSWLNALGQVVVELELEDRRIEEEVTTWQACVITEFQDEMSHPGNETSRSVSDLVHSLEMDETLVRNALNFWVGKLVLRETSTKDKFEVLEALDSGSKVAQATARAAVVAQQEVEMETGGGFGVPVMKSADEVMMEKMNVPWQFIQGMLTNQGAMQLPQMLMMLKMLVPGGVPFGSEELRDFLGLMIKEENLELVGGKYQIPKAK